MIVRHCIWKARLGGARWLAAGEQLWGCGAAGTPGTPGLGFFLAGKARILG